MDLAEAILQRGARMRTERAQWDAHWQAVRDVSFPTTQGFTALGTPGGRDRWAVLHSGGETMGERLAAALDGLLTPTAVKWIDLETVDGRAATDDELRWLERARDTLLAVFAAPQTGFRSAIQESYLDLTHFGTSCVFSADRPGRLPLYRCRPLQSVHVAESADGRVDTVFCRLPMPARQVIAEWPDSYRLARVKAAADAGSETDLTVWHCVLPSGEKIERLETVTKKPFASLWLLEEEKAVLASGGYDELPFAVARWSKRPGEAYGRGPGMKALPDLQMLQRMMRASIVAAEVSILPSYMIADDGVAGPVDLRSGRGNVVRADMLERPGDPIRPIQRGARPDLGIQMMDYVLQQIAKAFLYDLLTVMQDPKMTATQILQLAEETNRVLGPVAGRLETELLAPLVERSFAILARSGAFEWADLPPPPTLARRPLRARFQSPMARAQRLSEVNGVVRTLEIMAPVADRDPSVLDIYDFGKIGRHVAEVNGMPAALLRSEDAVRKMVAERNAQLEQDKQIEQASKGAGGAARLISALGKSGAPAADAGAPQ